MAQNAKALAAKLDGLSRGEPTPCFLSSDHHISFMTWPSFIALSCPSRSVSYVFSSYPFCQQEKLTGRHPETPPKPRKYFLPSNHMSSCNSLPIVSILHFTKCPFQPWHGRSHRQGRSIFVNLQCVTRDCLSGRAKQPLVGSSFSKPPSEQIRNVCFSLITACFFSEDHSQVNGIALSEIRALKWRHLPFIVLYGTWVNQLLIGEALP